MKDSRRIRQVNRLIMEEVGGLILTELEDANLGQRITVTGVETSKDLRHARVYVSVLGDEGSQRACIEALQGQAKHLRYLLGRQIRLKYLPELDFRLDETLIHAERIERVLDEVLPHKTGKEDLED